MTADQIRDIVDRRAFPGAPEPAEWLETHISWVILTPEFAFKIKKPVVFGFLDFGTPEQRAYFCREELRLNRRLAPHMYLDVAPVGIRAGQLAIGAPLEETLDYAVQMRRQDNRRQLDRLLATGKVSAAEMEQLAAVLAPFHRQVALSGAIVYHPGAYWADFAELYRLGADIAARLGPEASPLLEQWRELLPAFLEQHAPRLQERVRAGFWVDGHGDLHTRNIFLTADGPLVFDCIEFNPHFRQSDILNELAFLCMDLDARGHAELATVFLEAYRRYWEVFPLPEDRLLFLFFKAYRANVRLKVALLELRQHTSADLEAQVQLYWGLMKRYLLELKAAD